MVTLQTVKTALTFTAVYTVAFFVYGLIVDSPLGVLYLVITIGLVGLFGMLHKWIGFSDAAWWMLAFVLLGNMMGGVWLVEGEPLYVTDVFGVMGYDKLFHAFAGFGMTFLAWEAANHWAGDKPSRPGMLIVTWLMVMGGGAVVEIAEFIGSTIGEMNVGDYVNNALDLVANATGATVAVLLLAWRSVPGGADMKSSLRGDS